jgi:EAL domain-containing protein (putative c-di-GMP-specific phosphodiesterase class I)
VQRDQLRDQECNLGQGYLFAKPLTQRQAAAQLRAPTLATPA